MLKIKLDKDPYDDRTLFTGNLTRTIDSGLTVLVGCNGSGKSTMLKYIEDKYKNNPDYKIFRWANTREKSFAKQEMLNAQRFDILSSLAFSSEGEEIDTNINILANQIGAWQRHNDVKDVIILLDGIDSGLSIDVIYGIKNFFKIFLIPEIELGGHECYVVMSANTYELAEWETCIDARSGKEMTFDDYLDFKRYILESRKLKNKSINEDNAKEREDE